MTGTEILAETPLAVSAGEWLSVTVTGTTASGYYGISGEVTPGFTAPTVTGASTAAGVVGSPFSSYTASANGTGPLVFSASNLPAGLSIDPGMGVIIGTPTAAGTYPAWIAVANAAGSSGRWVSFTIAPAIPPGKPTALVPVTIGSSVITLYWNAPTGSPAAASYEVEANNVSFGTTTDRTMTLTGLTPGTLYNLKVRAASAAGVWSQWSADYIAATAPAVAPGRSASVWMELPHRQRDPNNGVLNSLYYTGVQDEILPFAPDGVIGFRWVDYQPSYTISAIGYDDGISLNDYWSFFNSSGADGSSVFAPRFAMPPLLFANLTSLIASVEATYATKEGETYQVYEDPVGSPVFSPTNLDLLGEEFPSPSTGTHSVIFPNYELISVYRPSFYVVRRGKPIGGARITLSGAGPTTVGIRTVGGSSVPTAGPITIGGMTIDVGVGTGSVAFPGGGTISINGGVVSVAGIAGLPNGPIVGTVGLGGLGSVEVDTVGNATVTVGGGVPVMSGVVIRANAAGGGEIALANGVGISVSSAGRMGLTLPPGTDPTTVQAVDIATRILSVGAGAVISVRDALGVITPLPTSGVLGALDAAITSKGLYEVGIKLGTDSTFWFDVFTFPKPRIAVDANRDGVIAFDASDATTSEKPYRFWINDDIDREHAVDGSDSEQDDISPAEAAANNWQPDWKNDYIKSKRDLEDFVRLWISTSGINDSIRSGQLFLGLKWTNVTGTPAIKLYPHIDPDGSTKYLTDDSMAQQQLDGILGVVLSHAIPDGRDDDRAGSHTVIEGDGVFVLPTFLFYNLTEAKAKTYLLFEGCKAGKGQLKLVILKKDGTNYTEIGDGGSVRLDLKKIGDMYEHWSVGNGSGATPDQVAGRIASETGSSSAFSYTTSSPEEQKYVLFVHGWNMEKWEKERFAETAYKRLYWQGYKGRFGLFSWPTTNNFGSVMTAILDNTNFDRGEYSAWRSAALLRQLLQTLNSAYGGELYVLSHSMGGIVTSEALRLQSDANGGRIAKVYVASQAALSAHAYDGTLSDAVGSSNALQWNYNHPQVPNGTQNYGPQTANVYKNWTAFVLNGSAVSSSAVGTLVNFYNENDWALSAPVWQFNQITKPDFADSPNLLWEYYYVGDFTGVPANDGFRKVGKYTNLSGEVILGPGNRTTLQDRYEIMSFDSESRVKAFGATPNISQGISGAVNLRSSAIWPADPDNHSAHKWHSGEFRSTIQRQRNYWKALLSTDAFNIPTTTLP